MAGGLRYRALQFFQALSDSATPEELADVQAFLSPSLYSIFLQLLPAEQAHAIRVYQQVQSEGFTDPDLLAAALLHDVGKARIPLKPWERVLYVLGEAMLPGLADRWGDREPKGMLRGFVVREQHAAWGAEMAASAGASEQLLRLIARHQDEDFSDWPEDEQTMMAVLQAADDVS